MAPDDASFSKEGEVLGASNLILFSFSTSHFAFKRLVSYVEKVAEKYDEEIVVQTGRSVIMFSSPRIHCVDFLPLDEFEKACQKAELVISQAGVGVVLSCLSVGSPLILVPRVSEYGETETNHQLEMYEVVSGLGVEDHVAVVETEEELLKTCARLHGKHYTPFPEGGLPVALCGYLKELERQNRCARGFSEI